MKNKTAGVLLLFFITVIIFGCSPASSTPTAVLLTHTPPIKRKITLTPYVDFYTSEERSAAAVTWVLADYNAPTAGEDGSVKCVPAVGKEQIQTPFALKEEQEKARFHGSTFFKTSSNLWTDGSTQFGVGGVTYTRTLQISVGQIEEVTTLYSPSGGTVTCVNDWKPEK